VRKIFHKLKNTVIDFLKQGSTPHELALAISLGVIIGMFPVQGITTLICTLIAIIFRLNLVVLSLANYLSIPLMLLTLIPFYVLGHEWFSNSTFHWGVDELLNLFESDFWGAISELSWSIVYAVFVWLIFVPIGMLILYFISIVVIKRSITKTSG